MDSTSGIVAYVLYLCVQSHMSCDVVKQDVKNVEGIKHYDIAYNKMEYCKDHAGKLSNVQPDKEGRYYIDNNKWYECRETTDQPNK
jgi:hypothetical protein